MKKKDLAVFLTVTALLTGCGASETGSSGKADSAPAGAETAQSEEIPASSVDDTGFILATDEAELVDEEPTPGAYGDYVALADYKGIQIEAGADTPIEEGMTANIDYSGRTNDTAFDGGNGSNYDLLVTSGSFMPGTGFEKQLIGKKTGDKFVITITMSEDYWDPMLAGKPVEYKVKVNKVYYTTPSMALSRCVEASKIQKYPRALYDEWRAIQEAQYLDLASPGQTLSETLALFGMDEKSLDSMVYAGMKNALVCRAILDAEGITESDATYEAGIRAILDRYGFKELDDMTKAGYKEAEIRNLIENEVAELVLMKYQAE